MKGDGDCYAVAVRIMHESPVDPRYRLCHGTPLGVGGDAKGIRYGHAWVEFSADTGQVWAIDRSNGAAYMGHREAYYATGSIEQAEVRRYDHRTMARRLVRYGTYGPWPR